MQAMYDERVEAICTTHPIYIRCSLIDSSALWPVSSPEQARCVERDTRSAKNGRECRTRCVGKTTRCSTAHRAGQADVSSAVSQLVPTVNKSGFCDQGRSTVAHWSSRSSVGFSMSPIVGSP